MLILGVDPGTSKTGICVYDTETETIARSGHVCNSELDEALAVADDIDAIVVERFESFGGAFGETCIRTVFAIGRFDALFRGLRFYVKRSEVKRWLTGNVRHRDKHVRQALIDRFGGQEKAIGSKKAGHLGPLYGVKTSHVWAALALCCYFQDNIEANIDEPPTKLHGARWRGSFAA
jgi:hypothetical protein